MTASRRGRLSEDHARSFDVLILGSGVAGLSSAVRLATAKGGHRALSIGVVTKSELAQAATRWAQGGVAAVLGGDEDSTDLHLADTLKAGAGLCDISAVRVLVDEGSKRMLELIALGAEFDREASGGLARAREGGHSRPRVVHAGGAATGIEVERALVEATRSSVSGVFERCFALDLLIENGRARGVSAVTETGDLVDLRCNHVVLTTGGAGQLFAVTTNPPEATGDGVAMALRAGALVADVEFMQFHPTALHHPAMPRPLLSEALRGHGAILRDSQGERFVDELASRDVVSRAMSVCMQEQGVDHLWLDATNLEEFEQRFPTISATLAEIGLDPTSQWLPIAPAAHHLAGGVLTDLWGATSVPGLWAAGESACTGVHGANRLASNSLLEGMVFGARVADAIMEGREGPEESGALGASRTPSTEDVIGGRPVPGIDPEPFVATRPGNEQNNVVAPPAAARSSAAEQSSAAAQSSATPSSKAIDADHLRVIMTAGAGLTRSAHSLRETAAALVLLANAVSGLDSTPGELEGRHIARLRATAELRNLVTVGSALVTSALARTESRGCHLRVDFPSRDDRWRCRFVHGPGSTSPATTSVSKTSGSTTERVMSRRASGVS